MKRGPGSLVMSLSVWCPPLLVRLVPFGVLSAFYFPLFACLGYPNADIFDAPTLLTSFVYQRATCTDPHVHLDSLAA